MKKPTINKKRKRSVVEETKPEGPAPLPAIRQSSEPIPKKTKWINKQRVMVLATRGISHRDRHLMEDIKKLMPHHRPESKMERSKTLSILNEMCEMKNCNKVLMFEGRKKTDLYMWLSNVPNGPSVKFLVENIYTMAELKLTGNCMRGSRPIMSFDPTFKDHPHYMVLRELLTQIFGVPKYHPKSQPFFDHVYVFSILDNRIWFRNFQILSEDGALAEVGPRFVLNPVKIFSGSFGGMPLWENPSYISPAKYRQQFRINARDKYLHRMQQKAHAEATRPVNAYKLPQLEDIFKDDPMENNEVEENDESKVTVRKPSPKKKKLKKPKLVVKKQGKISPAKPKSKVTKKKVGKKVKK